MNFKEMYKSANNDISANKELINDIFEKAQKKERHFAPVFSYALTAAIIALAVVGSYSNIKKITETSENDTVAMIEPIVTDAPEVLSNDKTTEESTKETATETAPKKVVVVGNAHKSDKVTDVAETPTDIYETATPELAEGSAIEAEPVRTASVIRINDVSQDAQVAKASMTRLMIIDEPESSEEPTDDLLNEETTENMDKQVTVTHTEKGGEASTYLESDEYEKSDINGHDAVIIYDGAGYKAYIDSGETDTTVTVNGATEEDLEEILNSIN